MTVDERNRELIRGLCRPEAYPWRPERVELIETHVSWVFLAGDRVVKVKRPVHFGFVDHSTLERRRHSCEEEVRLNRRLTDGVYVDAVPITGAGDDFLIGGEGPVVEWATLMRRLPAERMLDVLLAAGSAPSNLADRLANRLIPFHLYGAGRCEDETDGSAPALAAVVTDNLSELNAFAGSLLGPVQIGLVGDAVRGFLDADRRLLERRIRDGWIRDGHGDLRIEHVCLEPDGAVQIFDCVEFNPAIRCADIASDLAFLLMDLDRCGAESTARDLEERYRAAGVDLPPALVRLYRTHRALVRAKVDCLTLTNESRAHPGMAGDAVDYLNLASRYALTCRPFLAAMTGLSGTGKSTVARSLARATGAGLHASDRVRKDLAGVAGAAGADWGKGIYDETLTERTYGRLADLARESLARDRPVILDATFLDEDRRQTVAVVAAEMRTRLVLVETVCDEEVVLRRLAARQERGDVTSDATAAIFRHQRQEVEASPPAVPAEAIAVRVDTTRDGPVWLDPVLASLHRAGLLEAKVG